MSSNAPQAPSPEVSVLIVFRNEARHIEHCIASIEAQFEPGQAWELLLIDGCSTDNSRELVEQYFANRSDVRWQLIHNPDKTLATGWNLGIQAASGTYIIRPDAHAALHPGYIGTALKVIEQKPDVELRCNLHTIPSLHHDASNSSYVKLQVLSSRMDAPPWPDGRTRVVEFLRHES